MKIKILIVAAIFLFSTYSVAHASNFAQFSAMGDENQLPEETLEETVETAETGKTEEPEVTDSIDTEETILDRFIDNDVPFQDELNTGLPINDPPVEVEQEANRYTVSEGDNLFRIALTHEIPIGALIGWNELTSDLIHPGDELIVSGDEEEAMILEAKMSEKVTAILQPKSPSPSSSPSASGGKELVVTATAYTAYCKGCSGTTAYGIDLRSNPREKVIAVDPNVVPLGTKVWVEGYGEAIAGDTGGAIKGHKIDVFIPSYDRAMEWGVKKVKLKVLN